MKSERHHSFHRKRMVHPCIRVLVLILLLLGMFQTSFSKQIYFHEDRFAEPVDANYWKAHPQKGIYVDSKNKIIFNDSIYFRWSIFDSTVNFSNCNFNSPTNIIKSEFRSNTYFNYVNFKSTSNFRHTKFKNTVNFTYAIFDSTADFRYVYFDSTANFTNAIFNSTAYFGFTFYLSTVYFDSSHFNYDVDFQGAFFGTKVSFNNATFEGISSFQFASLPDTLDFRNVNINSDVIDLTTTYAPISGKKCQIALLGTDLSKLKITMENFELWFPDNKNSRLTEDTLIKSNAGNRYDDTLSIYESVLKNLSDNGYSESYKKLDIKLKGIKYKHAGGLYRYLVNPFLKYWWNYGYEPLNVFGWTLFILVSFTFINSFIIKRLLTSVYKIKFIYISMEKGNGPFKRKISCLFSSLIYTSIIFFGLKMDVDKFRTDAHRNHPCLFTYLIIIYICGIICIGFMVNIIFRYQIQI